VADDRLRSPDPIDDPKAYQSYLLALLGSDDPAAVQERTASTLHAVVDRAGPDLRTRPEPSEWSVLQCLAHIVDAETVMSGRYRFVLAQDEPPLVGYDQDLWVDTLHGDDDPAELLKVFEILRPANIALWRAATAEQRARVGMHAERGPESFDLAFRMLAGHDRFHVAQAERALATVREM
jgi:DinB family protein